MKDTNPHFEYTPHRMPGTYTAEQVAEMLQVHVRTIRRRCAVNAPDDAWPTPVVRIGTAVRIVAEPFHEWLNSGGQLPPMRGAA